MGKSRKAPKKKGIKEHSEKLPETSLEKEAKENPEIISEDKKEIDEEGFFDELDSSGIISSGELRQILKSETQLRSLENIPVSRSLEGGLIFAPRVRDKKEAEGKVYADTKYTKQYMENKYGEKTPGNYAGKETSSEKSSSDNSNSNGNK